MNTGKPNRVDMILSDPSSAADIEHVGLYMNLHGIARNIQDSDAYIVYEKYKPLEIFDKNGLFAKINVETKPLGSLLDLSFDITFSKPMNKSDVIVRAWTLDKRSTDIDIPEAIQVIETQSSTKTSGILNPQNSNMTECQPSVKGILHNKTSVDLIPVIKRWTGYSGEPISDSELLKYVGIYAHHIPSWFMKTSKLVLSCEVSQQEFVNALEYLHDKGFMK